MFGTLFETPEDKAVQHIYDVLKRGSLDGLQPSARQRELLRILVDKRGSRNAIKIGRIAEIVHTSPRAIKDDVRELRLLFRVRIGSSRDSVDGGLYLITSTKELLETVAANLAQLRSEAEVLRAMCEPHELRELEGQLILTTLPSAADLDAVAAEERARAATSGTKEGTDAHS